MLRLAATIPCALALTACGDVQPTLILPPVELTHCADEPAAPELPEPGLERDRIVLDYILAWRSAHGDCKAKVDGLKAWRETAR